MVTEEFQKFTSEGHFTIKRTDKFWSGVWFNMTIEQTLMRLMKSSGGLTRGRGIIDSVIMKWSQNMSAVNEVCQRLEDFCGLSMVFFRETR